MIKFLFLLSLLITFLHILDEALGEEIPIWYSFGHIVGIRISNLIGFLTFSIALGLILTSLAVGGYLYQSTFLLSILLGSRIGDMLISHWGLTYFKLSNPNPGFFSSFLFIPEIIWILSCFSVNWFGVLTGITAFILVIPILYLIRLLVPKIRFGYSDSEIKVSGKGIK